MPITTSAHRFGLKKSILSLRRHRDVPILDLILPRYWRVFHWLVLLYLKQFRAARVFEVFFRPDKLRCFPPKGPEDNRRMKCSHNYYSYRDHRTLEDHEVNFVIGELGVKTLLELDDTKDRSDVYSYDGNAQCWCDKSVISMMARGSADDIPA